MSTLIEPNPTFSYQSISDNLQEADKLYFQSRYFEAHKLYESVFAHVSYKMGLSSCKIGKFSDSFSYLREAREIMESRGEDNPLERVRILNAMGEVYFQEGDYDDAEYKCKQAIQILKEHYGQDHRELAAVYNKLAYIKEKQEKYNEEFYYLRMAEKISMQKKSENDDTSIELATTYSRYASAYSLDSPKEKAYEYIEKALAIRQQLYGESHVEIAQCYLILGRAHQFKNLNSEALEAYNKGIKMIADLLGENHPELAELHFYSGSAHHRLGEVDEALVCHGKALSIQEEFLPRNHLSNAFSYTCSGVISSSQGKMDEAAEFFNKAFNIFSRKSGVPHSLAEMCVGELMDIYKKQWQYKQARRVLKRMLGLQRKAFGKIHPKVAKTYCDLAQMYQYDGKGKKAIRNAMVSIQIDNSFKQTGALLERTTRNILLQSVAFGNHLDTSSQLSLVKKGVVISAHQGYTSNGGFNNHCQEIQKKKCLTEIYSNLNI